MDSLDTTLFRLPEFKLPFSPTSSGRLFAGFTVATITPGICVNFAPINEIMLFLLFYYFRNYCRTHFQDNLVPSFGYSMYFEKIYRFIYAEFSKGNTIVGKLRIQDFRA